MADKKETAELFVVTEEVLKKAVKKEIELYFKDKEKELEDKKGKYVKEVKKNG